MRLGLFECRLFFAYRRNICGRSVCVGLRSRFVCRHCFFERPRRSLFGLIFDRVFVRMFVGAFFECAFEHRRRNHCRNRRQYTAQKHGARHYDALAFGKRQSAVVNRGNADADACGNDRAHRRRGSHSRNGSRLIRRQNRGFAFSVFQRACGNQACNQRNQKHRDGQTEAYVKSQIGLHCFRKLQ